MVLGCMKWDMVKATASIFSVVPIQSRLNSPEQMLAITKHKVNINERGTAICVLIERFIANVIRGYCSPISASLDIV